MGLIQRLERTAAEQFAAFPGGLKRNARLAQSLKVKGVNTFRRGVQRHAMEVLTQEGVNVRAGKIVSFDLHGESFQVGRQPHDAQHKAILAGFVPG